MSIAVLSSVHGAYDVRSTPPPQTIEADWIFVTDVEVEIEGWRTVVEPRPHMHPRLAAKIPKCLPWEYTDADTVVWIDGYCQLLEPTSLEQILDGAASHSLAQIDHPWRQCIADEAIASIGMLKYEGQPIRQQVDHYLSHGHPLMFGLWATGLIVRNAPHGGLRQRLDAFGRRWLAEQVRWSYQDQLSEPPLLRFGGLRPHTLPFPLHGSGVVSWTNHRDES